MPLLSRSTAAPAALGLLLALMLACGPATGAPASKPAAAPPAASGAPAAANPGASAAAPAAAAPTTAAPVQVRKLVLGVPVTPPNMVHIAPYVADEQGFFRDVGLEVEFKNFE